jgi:hypothetical protein
MDFTAKIEAMRKKQDKKSAQRYEAELKENKKHMEKERKKRMAEMRPASMRRSASRWGPS